MKNSKESYSKMSDEQWVLVENLLHDKRKRRHTLRLIIDAIFWINNTGAQCRNLDKGFPAWQTVFYHFTQLKKNGFWNRLLLFLGMQERLKKGLSAFPSLLAIDSQSVKITQFTSIETGIDGHKMINGRKRTILVDKDGLLFAVKVTAANISDNEAGILCVEKLKEVTESMQTIAGDKGFKEKFKNFVKEKFGWNVEIAQKPESKKGFVPQKNRWH